MYYPNSIWKVYVLSQKYMKSICPIRKVYVLSENPKMPTKWPNQKTLKTSENLQFSSKIIKNPRLSYPTFNLAGVATKPANQ